jgi:hypothetical protein
MGIDCLLLNAVLNAAIGLWEGFGQMHGWPDPRQSRKKILGEARQAPSSLSTERVAPLLWGSF